MMAMNSSNRIKSYQKVLLSLFKKIVDVCDAHQIQYFLVDGSCLGAVRHKGFIPWDDDVDMTVFSTDHEYLISILREELGNNFAVEGAFEQDVYPNNTDMGTKVYDLSIKIKTSIFLNNEIEHPWVDITLLCGAPKNILLRKLHMLQIRIVKGLLKFSNKNSIGFNSDKYRSLFEKIILYIARKIDLSKVLKEEVIAKWMRRILTKYNPRKSDFLFSYPSDYRNKEIVHYSIYGNGRKCEFENMFVTIPAQAEMYLEKVYGSDYMVPPLKNKRHTHSVEVIE